MIEEIILASKSKVRKKILEDNGIKCTVEPSNVDEDLFKKSLLKEGASPEIVSKNLAEEAFILASAKLPNKNKLVVRLGA